MKRDHQMTGCHGRERARLAALLLVLTALGGAARGLGQEGAGSPRPPLAIKQDMIRDRLSRFRDRAFRLQQELVKLEPENAERLARALGRLGEVGATDKLDELVRRLGEGENLRETLGLQEQTVSDLELVLAVLLQRDSQNAERREEMDRLAERLQEIGRLLNQQRDVREQTAAPAESARLADELRQAKQEAEALLERQERLRGDGAQRGNDADAAAKRGGEAQRQEQLAHDAESLEQKLKSSAALPRPNDPASQDQKPGATPEDANAAAREAAQQAAESVEAAARQMSQAGESLKAAEEQPAKEAQQQAEAQLRRAIHQIQEAQDQLKDPPKPDASDLARRQRELAEQAAKLSKDAQPQNGGDNPSQPPQPSPRERNPAGDAPPTDNVQRAEREMWDAAEKLERQEEGEAVAKQDKAIDALQEAKRELEEALQQKRKEEREEMLRDLEARFHDLVIRQKRVNDETAALDGVGAEHFQRAEELEAARLADAQNKLAESVGTCFHILEEEGTTIVFPRILEQTGADMRLVAERLVALQTGALTQSMQKEILEALGQLLEAVRHMQQEQEQQDQQQQQSASPMDQNSPLLPTSAELKLLRAAQTRVHERTSAIDSALSLEGNAADVLEKTIEATARRQRECAEIARQLRERVEQNG